MDTYDLCKSHLCEKKHILFALLEYTLKFIPNAVQTRSCKDNTNSKQVALGLQFHTELTSAHSSLWFSLMGG